MNFFGSLVSVYNDSSEEYLIIDGQQRVTTVSLLLAISLSSMATVSFTQS